MDPPRDPFGFALSVLRIRLRSGRLVQGEQLMARDLARELRLSPTPIREALARLAGEGLIEDRRPGGYFAWRLDTVDLIELNDLQAVYLRAALDASTPISIDAADPHPAECEDGLAQAESLLRGLVRRGQSQSLLRAHDLLADRLAPARRAEAEILRDADREWRDLAAALDARDATALGLWVVAYRQRRAAAAAEIVRRMRSRASDLAV